MDNVNFLDNKYIKNIQTPAYLFDINKLYNQINIIKNGLEENVGLCYAMKANPFLVKYIDKKVDRIEVCSPGEYEICISNNVNLENIIISGVNKTEETLTRIIEYSCGKGIYTIESKKHFELLLKCAKKFEYKLDVILRLSSGNQFGIDKNELESMLNQIGKDEFLNVKGIHYYSGTQKKLVKIKEEIENLDNYVGELKKKYNIKYIELEYGPGMVVNYFNSDKVIDIYQQLQELKISINNMDNVDKVVLEFGRFIVANCGYYLSKINDIKKVDETNYIILDGGIHQVNYYGQIMGMKKPFMKILNKDLKMINIEYQNDSDKKWQLCGSLCTLNDILVKDVMIKEPQIGDIFIFENTGAYSVTEGMALFLSRELPTIYIINQNKELICVRKKTETYLLNGGL